MAPACLWGRRADLPSGAAALRRAKKGNKASLRSIKANADRHATNLAPVIETLRIDGAGSLWKIAEALNERGMLTPRGGRWNRSSVRNLLGRIGQLETRHALVSANNFAVLEACSFQDITGQRVNKVIKFVTHVEGRIDALCEIWGRDGIAGAPVNGVDARSEDEKLLRGPALKNEGVSQKDIDALFD